MDEDRLVKRKQKARRDGNVKQIADVSKELGDIYFESGRLNEALSEYNEQLRACEALNDKLDCAIAHRMIGEVRASLGDYEEALTHQTLHLEGAKEADSVLEQQRALATIGRTQFCLGETLPEDSADRTEAFSAAKKAYSKSLRLCDRLESTDIKPAEMMTMRARLLLNLGLVLEEQKQPHEAVELIEKAAELCKKHKLDEDLHRTHIALGALHERQNHFGLALKHVDMAIETGNSALRAVGRLTKAELLLRLGHWTDARQILVRLYRSDDLQPTTLRQVERLLQIVVTICRAEDGLEVESDLESRQKLYEKLGDASVAARSYDKAIEYYRQMLSCAEADDSSEQISAALVSLVQTFRDANRFDEAVPFARRELQLCNEPSEICRSALNLADLLYLTNAEKSSIMEIYDLALETARNVNNRSMEATILKDMHVYLREIGNFDEAAETKKKLDVIGDAIVDVSSETESENTNIGADICLEDLSDVEAEMQRRNDTTNVVSRSSRRPKRGLVVKRNDKGETKLHVACINGNFDEVEKLLNAGHPTNVRDNAGWTPLHEAANHGYVEIAEILIKSGANVNDPGGLDCGGVTPLHDAASCGNFSTIILLLREGADVKLRTKDGDDVLNCLENWRERVGELSLSEQTEYDVVREKLSAVVPKRTERTKKSPYDGRRGAVLEALVDDDDDDDDEKISASEDYRRTIASLMNRRRTIVSSTKKKRCPAIAKKSSAPLVDCDETLTDDWLEDDLNCTVKEKSLVDDCLPPMKRKSSNTTPDGIEKISKRQRLRSNEKMEISNVVDDDSCDGDCNEISDIVESRISNVSRTTKKQRSKQISLFKSGFTRDSTSRTPSPVITYSVEKTTNFDVRDDNCESELIRLMIRIEDKVVNLKLRFPEQREITVSSIVKDIAAKFEDETGCRVRITLTTMSGRILVDDDTLKDVKAVDGIVRLVAEIVENEIPPIVERYAKICKNHRIQPREAILKALKICDDTSTFRLKTVEPTDDEIIPILKTLEYQQKLEILQLSDFSLFQAGETFNNAIKRHSTLQELHLQGCDIDDNFILKIDRFPSQLRIIDLSYNPLGQLCQEKLYKLISHNRYLQTLNLRFCKLENFSFSNGWNSLVNLDLSCNPIGEGVASSFLQRQMIGLNLSNTKNFNGRCNVVREIINGSNLSLSTLETLELSRCDVKDSDVVDVLSKTPNLSKFVVSGNADLTEIGLIAALTHKPTLSLVDFSGCKKIVDEPNDDVFMDNPRVCTLIVSMSPFVGQSWLDLWRGTAEMKKFPHDVVAIRPIVR